DTLRPEAPRTIAALKEAGVRPVLLTGDHAAAAATIAARVGIEDVHPDCLPEDKMRFVEQNERSFEHVCMIGDGINDAPALKRARVGIAMGGIGSDIAIDAADIVLVDDDIHMLSHVFKLARRTMRTIRGNLTFSMALNFAAIALAMTGILNPVTGALVHNAGSVFVIINSIFLLNWESEARRQPSPASPAPSAA
ncbi:MAG: HAD-IC family P-type ATPase, partial [Desulfovibrionaceae bacterium]|nr:HAD-IC family P-type ATPase [Desulfovibrionaceae bacterium]